MDSKKLKEAIDLFDNANRQDPNRENVNGKDYPKELLYAERLENWVRKLETNPSEALLLASHCQHLCRWEIPRSDYESGKIGYLKWRKKLAEFHSEKATKILKNVGYPDEIIQQVQSINLKRNLKSDSAVQTMEDALCLVFLEFQFEEFMQKTPIEKIPQIIKKTWEKMSEKGKSFALNLPFSDAALDLIKKSLDLK